MNDKALAGALDAIKRGLRAIPMTPTVGEDSDGKPIWLKHARIENWPTMATGDPETLRRWASGDLTGTTARKGKPNGKGSPIEHWGASLDGFFAFDTDTPEALSALKNLFQQAGFEDIVPTFTTKTGRDGYHFLYRQPKGYTLGNSVGALAKNLDTRGGAGGLIILPGTTNPVSGKEYTVARDAGIATLPEEVAKLIKTRVSKAKKPSDTGPASRREGSIPDTKMKIARAIEWLSRHDGGVEGNGGDADAMNVGLVMADIGLSEERALALTLAIYNPKCEPPWEPEELAVKIHNGYAYRENEIGCADPDLAVSALDEEHPDADPDGDEEALPIESMAVFRETPPEPRHSLIEGFMAHGEYLTLIYGRGGSGKSLLIQQMLRELIRGKSFLGMKAGDACKDLRPYLLSCEEPREDVHFRYSKQSLRIDPEGKDAEPLWTNLRGKPSYLFERGPKGIIPTPLYTKLIRRCKKFRINLLVIDSLSRIFPGNEIDRVEVTAFGTAIDHLCEETHAHVIVLAHTNRAGEFSGSTAWEANCRQMYLIKADPSGDGYVYTMTVEKTNEGRRGVQAHYRFDDWYFAPLTQEEIDAQKKKDDAETKAKAYLDAASIALPVIVKILQERGGALTFRDLENFMRDRGFNRKTTTDAIGLGISFGDLQQAKGPRSKTGNYPQVVSLTEKGSEFPVEAIQNNETQTE